MLLICLIIAVLQIIAIGSQSSMFFQALRLVMPLLAFLTAYGLSRTNEAPEWIAAFVMIGLVFFGLPRQSRLLVWLPINGAVAVCSLTYVGHVMWRAVMG